MRYKKYTITLAPLSKYASPTTVTVYARNAAEALAELTAEEAERITEIIGE